MKQFSGVNLVRSISFSGCPYYGSFSGCPYGPYMARLAAKQETGFAPLGCYITAHGPPI